MAREPRVHTAIRLSAGALRQVDALVEDLNRRRGDVADPIDRSTMLRELLALGIDAYDAGKRRTLPRR